MSITNEINALKQVIEALATIPAEARGRVIGYANEALKNGSVQVPATSSATSVAGRRRGRPPGKRGPGRPPKADATPLVAKRGPGRPPKVEVAPSVVVEPAVSGGSIKDFLKKYDFKVATKTIAAAGVYLTKERGQKSFALKDLITLFKEAGFRKIPAYSQFSRAVVMNYLAKKGEGYTSTSRAEALLNGGGKTKRSRRKK